jgi:hypothetical protein
VIRPSGLLVVGGSSGLFRMQWSQVTSTASATTVRAGSYVGATQPAQSAHVRRPGVGQLGRSTGAPCVGRSAAMY